MQNPHPVDLTPLDDEVNKAKLKASLDNWDAFIRATQTTAACAASFAGIAAFGSTIFDSLTSSNPDGYSIFLASCAAISPGAFMASLFYAGFSYITGNTIKELCTRKYQSEKINFDWRKLAIIPSAFLAFFSLELLIGYTSLLANLTNLNIGGCALLFTASAILEAIIPVSIIAAIMWLMNRPLSTGQIIGTAMGLAGYGTGAQLYSTSETIYTLATWGGGLPSVLIFAIPGVLAAAGEKIGQKLVRHGIFSGSSAGSNRDGYTQIPEPQHGYSQHN